MSGMTWYPNKKRSNIQKKSIVWIVSNPTEERDKMKCSELNY